VLCAPRAAGPPRLPRADLEVAVALVEAAGAAVRAARERPVVVEAKTAATDVVTAADHAAEAAMVAILGAERPGDGILGEEGASADTGAGGRTWVLDALDGTLNFATGLGPYCCAAALVADGRALAVAVLDPIAGRRWTATAGEGAFADDAPIRARGPERLADAILATYAHPDRKGRAGVIDGFRALVEHAGMLRIIGSGTLDLAWVAEGRLHGWVQPGVEPWDWYPGALLVAEAGGVQAEVVRAGTPWRVAAANAALLDELVAVLAA
jgi:myo-inositol-1(or 4)-monophosphatase